MQRSGTVLSDVLEQLQIWIEQIIRTTNYIGIALLMLAENLFPPIPSEIVMPFAGFLVNDGMLSLWGVLLAGTIGAVAGAGVIYYVGSRTTEAGVSDWVARHGKWLLLQSEDIERVMRTFRQRGSWIVFIGRFIPGIRSLISLPAGVERMALTPFLLYTTLGTLAWNGLLVGGGMILGENWQRILDWIDRYETIIWLMFAGWVVYRLYNLYFKSKKAR